LQQPRQVADTERVIRAALRPPAATGQIDKNRLRAEYPRARPREDGPIKRPAGVPSPAGKKVESMSQANAKLLRKSVPSKARRTKAEQRAETLEQILDAAALLFSKRGLYGVTLRDVALEVGVHTSLMHYYFEDKLALFKAVFARRAHISSDRRMKALEQYEKDAGGKPTVAGALHVFLDTDFDLYIEGGEVWRNYAAFGAQLANTAEGAEMFDEHFDPVVLRLIGILRKALPDVPKKDIFWGYHFVTGSLMHSLAASGRIDRLSGGLCKSSDFAAVKARMADFMAAGFLSFVQARSKPPSRPAPTARTSASRRRA
jgi:AcrR family transcriptional regulator